MGSRYYLKNVIFWIIFNMMMLISIILKTLPGCHPQLEAIKEEKRNEQKPKNELPVNLKRLKEN